MKAKTAAGLLGAAVTVLLAVTTATAQLKYDGWTLEGDVEVGVRGVSGVSKNESAMFEQYRDMSKGLFLPGLHLRLTDPEDWFSLEFGGNRWGQKDQEYFGSFGMLGLWEFGMSWIELPHTYSTNARILATETGEGIFTLPTPRPFPRPNAIYNTGREPDWVGIDWKRGDFHFKLTPTPDLDLILEYIRLEKEGNRPLGVAMGTPGGNFIEVLEPINQTTEDFRIRGTYAKEQWQIQFGYTLSLFRNEVGSVITDNPLFGTGAEPRAGQISVAPDNSAHTIFLQGGLNVPFWRTRFTGGISYSLRLQDENFLPHSINSALNLNDPALALPQRSLDGKVGITVLNLNATSRPLAPLTVSAKYRLYDYNDMTDQLVIPGNVENDQVLRNTAGDARISSRYDYTKQNADLTGRWRFLQNLAGTLGGGWERWDRNDHREVQKSDEWSVKAAIDWTATDWLTTKLTYRPSWRRGDDYNTNAHLAHSVLEEPTERELTLTQSLLLRKFDEANRDRQRVDALVQFMPFDKLTASLAGSYRLDNYPDTRLGLQDVEAWSVGLDLTWAPTERLAFSAGYNHDWSNQEQRSRSRPVTGGVAFDFPDYDWVSKNKDEIDTLYFGVRYEIIPKVLQWSANASFSWATGRIENSNPQTPTSGTPAQDATATVQRMPAFDDRMIRIDTSLAYRFWTNWTAKLGYIFEDFHKHDWRTDQLNPFMPGSSSIWLGNNLEDYTAHVVAFSLGYRF